MLELMVWLEGVMGMLNWWCVGAGKKARPHIGFYRAWCRLQTRDWRHVIPGRRVCGVVVWYMRESNRGKWQALRHVACICTRAACFPHEHTHTMMHVPVKQTPGSSPSGPTGTITCKPMRITAHHQGSFNGSLHLTANTFAAVN